MKNLLILAVVLVSGCAALRSQPPLSVYDLGTGPLQEHATASEPEPSAPRRSVRMTITAPVWLDSPAIRYRLAYHDPARIHVYSGSRWAGTPAALLAQRIKDRIAAAGREVTIAPGEGVRADYALHLELEEFSQVFDSPRGSHVVVKLHASLVRPGQRTLVAQRGINVEQPAQEASAAGAAHALAAASDRAAGMLLDWLERELSDPRDRG